MIHNVYKLLQTLSKPLVSNFSHFKCSISTCRSGIMTCELIIQCRFFNQFCSFNSEKPNAFSLVVAISNFPSTLAESLTPSHLTRHVQHMPDALSKNTEVNPSIWDRTSKTKYSIRLFFKWSIADATLTTFAASVIVGAGTSTTSNHIRFDSSIVTWGNFD